MTELNAAAIHLFRQCDEVLKNNKLSFIFQQSYENNVFTHKDNE